MLGFLAEEERGIEELSTRLELKGPAVSHHLAKLSQLGLVTSRTEGNNTLYRLDVDGLQEMTRDVMSSLHQDSAAVLMEGLQYENWERKILDNYVDGERIKSLPAGYKKRLVVLKWAADHFEFDRKYSEREVNEIIERHHVDYCTLRREMVEEGLMERSEGVYWRLEWEMPDL